MLWFTTRLETMDLDDFDDSNCSSPLRIANSVGSKVYYRLTPDTYAWIAGMIERAEKKHGLPESFLLLLRGRHSQIKKYAIEAFPAAEIEAAVARGGVLPVEVRFDQ